MSKCQYPGCHKEAKMKWCVTHNSVVSRERTKKRWDGRQNKVRTDRFHAGTAGLMLGYNCDDCPSQPKRVDWADRPLGDTGVEFEVRRGSKIPKSE